MFLKLIFFLSFVSLVDNMSCGVTMMAQFKVTSSTTCPEQAASRLLVFSLVWNSLVKERLSVFLKKNEEKGRRGTQRTTSPQWDGRYARSQGFVNKSTPRCLRLFTTMNSFFEVFFFFLLLKVTVQTVCFYSNKWTSVTYVMKWSGDQCVYLNLHLNDT